MFQWVRSKVYRNFLPKMPFEPNSWRSESRTAARFGVNNTRLTQDIDLRQGKRFLFIRFHHLRKMGAFNPVHGTYAHFVTKRRFLQAVLCNMDGSALLSQSACSDG
jgi:hypothetical protein